MILVCQKCGNSYGHCIPMDDNETVKTGFCNDCVTKMLKVEKKPVITKEELAEYSITPFNLNWKKDIEGMGL